MKKQHRNRLLLIWGAALLALATGSQTHAQGIGKIEVVVRYARNTSTSTNQTSTFTVPTGVTNIEGRVWGGGGGGGGATRYIWRGHGGGGGSGAYTYLNFGAGGGQTATITIGKAGAGGAASGGGTTSSSVSSGSAGGDSKIVYNGTTITAGGGGGGGGGRGVAGSLEPVTGSAGTGGTASGGTTNINGNNGQSGTDGDNLGGAAVNGGGNQGGTGYETSSSQNTRPGGAGGGGILSLEFDLPNVYIGTDKTNVCSGGSTTLRVYMPIAGVTYNWYRSSTLVGTGTTYTTSTAGTYSVRAVFSYNYTGTAPSSVIATYEADDEDLTNPVVNTTSKTITVYSANKVVLKEEGCLFYNAYEEGTLLFKEDFGGNLTTDPYASAVSLPAGVTSYTFVPSSECGAGDGKYSIQKEYLLICRDDDDWPYVEDHTYPGDPKRGYFMFVNADYEKGQFYQTKIDNLCSGMTLYFSAWIANIINDPNKRQPNLVFEVYDGANPSTMLTSYSTGYIGPEYTTSGTTNSALWNRYGFTFKTESESVILKITNKAPGGNGNDLGLDDIEVRLCTPPVNVTPAGDELDACTALTGTYNDSQYSAAGVFGKNLTSRWEYSTTGNSWTTVTGTQQNTTTGSVSSSYTPSQAGYYRLIVSNTSSIEQVNCRAVSRVIKVNAVTLPEITTPAQVLCTGSTLQMEANVTGGTWSSSNTSVATINASTGLVTPLAPGTAYMKYTKGCESNLVAITVKTLATASVITAAGTTACAGQTATLTASASSVTSPVFNWYDSAGALVATGNSYTTPALSASETWYVSVEGTNYCPNEATGRKAVTITVNPVPQITEASQGICIGDVLDMTVNVAGGTWSSSNTSVASINASTGSLKALSIGTADITYTANGCTSAVVTISVSQCSYIRVNPHTRATFK